MTQHDASQKRVPSWVMVAGGIAIFLVAFAFFREYVRKSDIAAELARMEAENAKLEREELVSLQMIARLSTQTELERQAREKMAMAAPGETVYVVPEDIQETSATNMQVAPAIEDDPSLGNAVKWFYYFFMTHEEREG